VVEWPKFSRYPFGYAEWQKGSKELSQKCEFFVFVSCPVKVTTTRHPAPCSCRKYHKVLPLENKTTKPENNVPAGTSATNRSATGAFLLYVIKACADSLFGSDSDACFMLLTSRLAFQYL
jgi:hypothetical protein